jgi:hypothetical protein
MFKKLISIAIILAACNATAGSSLANAKIKMIGYDKNIPDVVFIKTDKPVSSQNKIDCHTDANWNYVLKLATPLEEKMYAALLAAQAAQQNITIGGSNQCNASYTAVETLHTLYVSN